MDLLPFLISLNIAVFFWYTYESYHYSKKQRQLIHKLAKLRQELEANQKKKIKADDSEEKCYEGSHGRYSGWVS